MTKSKTVIFFIVFVALILAFYQSFRIDIPDYEKKLIRHTTIIDNSIEYPYKYRLINPYITHLYFSVLKSFLSEKAAFILAYLIQNLLVYGFLIFAVFTYLSLWFDYTGSIIGTMLFALIIPLSLTGYDTLGDMATAALMAIGFTCANRGRILLMYPLVFLGTFNEMQIILLIMFYFIGAKTNFSDKKSWMHFFGLTATFVLAYAVIYLLRGGQAGGGDIVWFFTKDASYNIGHKGWMVLWFILIVPFLYFVFRDLKSKPEFLRRNLLFTLPVFYFCAFFFIGRMREIDKALTIFLILIPLALFTLIPNNLKSNSSNSRAGGNPDI